MILHTSILLHWCNSSVQITLWGLEGWLGDYACISKNCCELCLCKRHHVQTAHETVAVFCSFEKRQKKSELFHVTMIIHKSFYLFIDPAFVYIKQVVYLHSVHWHIYILKFSHVVYISKVWQRPVFQHFLTTILRYLYEFCIKKVFSYTFNCVFMMKLTVFSIFLEGALLIFLHLLNVIDVYFLELL